MAAQALVAFPEDALGLDEGDCILSVWDLATNLAITPGAWTLTESPAGVGLYDLSIPGVTTPCGFYIYEDGNEAAVNCPGTIGDDQDVLSAIAGLVIEPLDAAAIRAAVGLATANLDVQLATIPALSTRIDLLISAGVVASSPSAGVFSPRYVQQLFDDIRAMLRDEQAGAYSKELMASCYNRAVEEICFILMRLGAEISFGSTTIQADGTHQDYALPGDFRAFVPRSVRPRIPATAVTNFTHGQPLTQVNQLGIITLLSSKPGTPNAFVVVPGSSSQYIRFNRLPTSGLIFDALYYPVAPTIASYASAGDTRTPWLGLLDELIKRTIEVYLREGLEYSIEARATWQAAATRDIMTLLSLRHLQARGIDPSLWGKAPRGEF